MAYPHSVVVAARDDFLAVEANAAHGGQVSHEDHFALEGGNVPQAQRVVS